jgi:hypothetical protein
LAAAAEAAGLRSGEGGSREERGGQDGEKLIHGIDLSEQLKS